MRKNFWFGFLVLFASIFVGTSQWKINQDWTIYESIQSLSAMAFAQDVFIVAGSTEIQFWSYEKQLRQNYTLDGQITSILVNPNSEYQFIYVSTKNGTIYSFYPPGHELELTQATTKIYPYDLYPNVLVWIGNSQILAIGTSRKSLGPQYYIYQTLSNGGLAFKKAVYTYFRPNTEVTTAALSLDFKKIAFYSPNNEDSIENGTLNETTMGSNLHEYYLYDDTLSDKFDDSALSNITNDGTIAYINNTLYLYDKATYKLYKATNTGLIEQTIYNRTDLSIRGIHQSIYSDQIVLSTVANDSKLYLSYFKPRAAEENEIQEIAYIEIDDRDGKNMSMIVFDKGMNLLGVGFEDAGQQTYQGGTPIASYVTPIAIILGVSLIVGLALLVKSGMKQGDKDQLRKAEVDDI